MFSNRFNTRNDPLLEAAQAAMKDGETRRQAEAFVNEQFGVYSRKAVVREELAAYDAALEEAYGALKEGVQIDEMAHKALTAAGYKAGPKDSTTGFGRTYTKGKKSVYVDADGFARHGSGSKATVTHGNKETAAYLNRGKKMEEGNDGNLANNYPPYDKVTRGDVIAGATGKDQMGGKKKAVKEGTAEAETSMSVTKDNKPSTPAQTNASTSGPSASDKAALASKIKAMREEEQIDELYGKGKLKGIIAARQEKEDQAKREYNAAERKMMDARSETGKAEKVKEKLRLRNISKPGDPHYNWAHSKKKLREEEQIDEAAYSAKAARAGKDIGKPGKQFSKIAKSAAKRYGSEERGKKVAGAILARIRAKHMKEEQIDEIVVQKSQMRPGETLGMAMNRLTGKTAVKGGANDPTSSKFKSGAQQGPPISAMNQSSSGSSTPDVKGNVAAMKAGQALAKTDAKNVRAGNNTTPNPTTTKYDSKGSSTSFASNSGSGGAADRYGSQGSSIPGSTSGDKNVGTGTATPAIKAALAPSTKPSKSMVTGGTFEESRLNESVQIGENTYRILK